MVEQMTTQAQLEALLFAAGRPMGERQLAKLAQVTPKVIREELDGLTARYKETGSALSLLRQDGKVQLVTDPQYGPLVEQFMKDEFTGPLSRAALETLAIIAYRGPIEKPAIDTIRGVNSGIMLRTLLIRGLVERKKSTSDARTYTYSLSMDFVRHLGLNKIADLPKYDELRSNEVLERFASNEAGDSMQKGEHDAA